MEMLWKNPEFVRHCRRELRPMRIVAAIAIPLVLCVLLMLLMTEGERDAHGLIKWQPFWFDLYTALLVIQGLLLAAWCATSCGQAVSSERQLRTFDFLRTTRLTSAELMTGMLFGRPITAFLIFAVLSPVTLLAGTASGHSIGVVLASVGLILAVCLCFAMVALVFSLLAEKPRSGELVALLLVYVWGVFSFSKTASISGNTALPALAVVPALQALNGEAYARVETYLFNHRIAPAWITLIFYAVFAAWCVVALVRNMKRDREELQLLSRWQALLFVVCINVLFLAQVRLHFPGDVLFSSPALRNIDLVQRSIERVVGNYLSLNCAVLYLIGVAMLAPAGNLKAWFRDTRKDFTSYWSESAPPVTWIALAGVLSWAVLAAVALLYSHSVPLGKWSLRTDGVRLGVVLVYALRDVLFLQWCSITRMRSPLMKGTLLLGLYYLAISMAVGFAQAALKMPDSYIGYAFVTPVGALANTELMASVQGAGVQVGIIVLLLIAIRSRFMKRVMVPAVA